MSEVEVSKVVGEGAPEAPLFIYLGAHLDTARLLFEKMTSDFAAEVLLKERATEFAKSEASSLLGEILNAFEVVTYFTGRAKFFGLDDFKPEDYIVDLLRAIRDLAKAYLDLKNGIDVSDLIYSLKDIKMRLEGDYRAILESLVQKIRLMKVVSENKS